MKKIIAGLAIIVSAGFLAACGAEVPAEHAVSGDNINEQVFKYEGADLHCVSLNNSTQYAVMSCDFVRWHAENPDR